MDALDRLAAHIDQIPAGLSNLSEVQLTNQQPGKWSRKEVLGHLIDSAINNLKRFTDAQFAKGPYLVQAYNQDELVRVNQYQHVPLEHLLVLWQSLNRQILVVARAIPEDTLSRLIQFSHVNTEYKTLEWLINDYVVHLEHHRETLL